MKTKRTKVSPSLEKKILKTLSVTDKRTNKRKKTYSEIAEQHSVSTATVGRIARAYRLESLI